MVGTPRKASEHAARPRSDFFRELVSGGLVPGIWVEIPRVRRETSACQSQEPTSSAEVVIFRVCLKYRRSGSGWSLWVGISRPSARIKWRSARYLRHPLGGPRTNAANTAPNAQFVRLQSRQILHVLPRLLGYVVIWYQKADAGEPIKPAWFLFFNRESSEIGYDRLRYGQGGSARKFE
jgi:hypothetical protein